MRGCTSPVGLPVMCGECKTQCCYGNCHLLLPLPFSEKFLCVRGVGDSPPAGCWYAEGIWYEGPNPGEVVELAAEGR